MIDVTDRSHRAFAVGVLAATFAIATMAVMRFVLDIPSLPEVLADVVLDLLPPTVFALLLDTLGKSAKLLLYGALGIGQLAAGGAIAIAYSRRRTDWWNALMTAAGLWALFSVVVFPLAGLGPLASSLRGGPLLTLLVLPASFLVYAAYLVWGCRTFVPSAEPWLNALSPGREPLSRRQFLARLSTGAAALAVAFGAWRRLAGAPTLLGSTRTSASNGVAGRPGTGAAPAPGAPSLAPGFDVSGLSPEVTTNADHYVVSKNFIDPSVDRAGWRLKIDGMVSRPLEFTYEQLRALPQVSNYYTLECISNVVGGDLMGTALWTGVRLADLIQLAGPLPGVVDAQLSAHDDYVESIPFDRALKRDTLLAFEMNGETLTESHGFPARLLIPGIYGMKNVKWLTQVSLVGNDVKGYWQHRGWSDAAEYKTMSRIDTPKRGASVAVGEETVAGVAFSGERGIKRIEVSFDDGASWTDATFKQPLSPYTWVLWTASWQAGKGASTIFVRATDAAGAVQAPALHGTVPDGSAGYHSVSVYAE